MQFNERDLSLLYDIYECCDLITKFTNDVKFFQYEKDIKIRLQIERLFEIVGQASKQISHETQEKLHNIQWKKMIGMRNILAHDYGEIRNDKVWNATQQSIPELLVELKKIDELMAHIKNDTRYFSS